MYRRSLRATAFGLLLSGSLGVAGAVEPAVTESGIAYVSGGFGQSEQASLLADKGRYSLWVTTAASGSGAYLSNAEVQVVDLKTRQTVLTHTMQGPWLFVALPQGRYAVEARYRASGEDRVQTARRTTTIGANSHRQLILYFKIPDPHTVAEAERSGLNPYAPSK